MGFAVLPPFAAYGIQGHGFAYRSDWPFKRQLEGYKREWAQRLETLEQSEPLCFPGWNDWDEDGRSKLVEAGNGPSPSSLWWLAGQIGDTSETGGIEPPTNATFILSFQEHRFLTVLLTVCAN